MIIKANVRYSSYGIRKGKKQLKEREEGPEKNVFKMCVQYFLDTLYV